jgi:hypothetical protein
MELWKFNINRRTGEAVERKQRLQGEGGRRVGEWEHKRTQGVTGIDFQEKRSLEEVHYGSRPLKWNS